MLSHGPKTEGTGVPHPTICEIIEELASEVVDENYRVAIYNSRGVTWRGKGGQQERDLAKWYDEIAEQLKNQWPRVASIYKKLAEGYRSEASHWDNDAAIDDIDRE